MAVHSMLFAQGFGYAVKRNALSLQNEGAFHSENLFFTDRFEKIFAYQPVQCDGFFVFIKTAE